jgi:hypothetical protein
VLDAGARADVVVVDPGLALVFRHGDVRAAGAVDVAEIDRAVGCDADTRIIARLRLRHRLDRPGQTAVLGHRDRLRRTAAAEGHVDGAVGADLHVTVQAADRAAFAIDRRLVDRDAGAEGLAAVVRARAERCGDRLRAVVHGVIDAESELEAFRIRTGADGLVIDAAVGRTDLARRPGFAVVVTVGEEAVGTGQLRRERTADALLGVQDRIERVDVRGVGDVLPGRVAAFRQRIAGGIAQRAVLGEADAVGLQRSDVHHVLAERIEADRGLAGAIGEAGRRLVIGEARRQPGRGRRQRRRFPGRRCLERDRRARRAAGRRVRHDAHGVLSGAVARRDRHDLRIGAARRIAHDLAVGVVEENVVVLRRVLPADGDAHFGGRAGFDETGRQVDGQGEVVAGQHRIGAVRLTVGGDADRIGDEKRSRAVAELGTAVRERAALRIRRERDEGIKTKGRRTSSPESRTRLHDPSTPGWRRLRKRH